MTYTQLATAVAYDEVLSLPQGVSLAFNGQVLGLLQRGLWRRSVSLGPPSPLKRMVLECLGQGPQTIDELTEACGGADADEVRALVEALRHSGWLVSTMRAGGGDRYTVQRLRPSCPQPADPTHLALSRFAVIHREAEGMVVESPLASARILLHDTALLPLIAAPDGDTPPVALGEVLVADLVQAGLFVPAASETGLDMVQWRPHELWFHMRSRMGIGGYSGGGFGRTLWAKPSYPPVPPRPDPYPGPAIELPRPDLALLCGSDRPLAAVMEERKSIREHDDESPMTATQLGELLYRCARQRTSFHNNGVDYTSRPYPSGGSLYELELYPVVRYVAGLDPGMYHYEPDTHRLRLVRGPDKHVAALLNAAMASALMLTQPQLLIVVSARFGRLMYNYEELPYALILKHVGVLYQSMYLTATAMGLAPCALGAGDVQAFARATGRETVTEGSVGEFMLGSRRGGSQTEGEPGGSAPTV